MANGHADIVWQHLCDLVAERRATEATDAQLLQRFVADGDDAAFAALVRRHGPLVWGVCRRVLHDWHAAEDAFQATFLILARKAATVTKRTAVAAWLYRVAYHAATRARVRADRQQRRERLARASATPDPLIEVTGRELLAALDEEVQRMAERYRAPLVLCYLEGRTRDEAAQALGWSLGTLKRRLEQGKARLRARLTRRGLTLSGGLLATALAQQSARAVPAGLVAATVQTAATTVRQGTASLSGPSALAEATMQAMRGVRVKIVAAGLLSLIGLGMAAGALVRRGPVDSPQAAVAATLAAATDRRHAPPPQRPAPGVPAADAAVDGGIDRNRKQTIAGRVQDDKAGPVADADVVVAGIAYPTIRAEGQPGQTQVLAQGKTDRAGRFHLTTRGVSSARFQVLYVLARREGYALGSRGLGRDDGLHIDAERLDLSLTLHPEQPIRGRLQDLQGQPAPHVMVQVIGLWVARSAHDYTLAYRRDEPTTGVTCWPPPATTDDQGRFTLHGLRADWTTTLLVQDGRFAQQQLTVNPQAAEPGKVAVFSLGAARVMEGTVTYEDNGRPVPGARVRIGGSGVRETEARTDRQGRFHMIPYTPQRDYDGAKRFNITAIAPDGQPYLHRSRELAWPKGHRVQQGLNLALPRGVMVRGRIVEQPGGRPVAGACIQYMPLHTNPVARKYDLGFMGPHVVSRADGGFELPVAPGVGHLLINGPTGDYVPQWSSNVKLFFPNTTTNYRFQADAIVPLDLPADARTSNVSVKLRRGVTVRGRLTGPQGEPVDEVLLFCLCYHPAGFLRIEAGSKTLRDGTFELHGCDPDKAAPVFFADPHHQWGATVQVSGKHAVKPLVVRLQPCALAEARFVDERGRPLRDMQVGSLVELVLAPGLSLTQLGKSTELVGITANAGNLNLNRWWTLRTDADGRITFPTLIPGATFRVVVPGKKSSYWEVARTFTAEAGKMLNLGDIIYRTSP
jgi:RNA polymerase sigma factor (sigma-70 family)